MQMKIFNKFLLFAALLAAGAACTPKEETILPADIKNVTATAASGQITLKWEYTADSASIFYVKVSYYDHQTKKDKAVLASNKGDSAVITGLLNRFGDYNFTLQTYSETQTPNANVHTIALTCKPVEPSYVSTGEVAPIPLTAEMISTNAQSASEGPIANLVDNNPDTYFHSDYSSAGAALKPHSIDVTFESVAVYDGVFGNEESRCGGISFKTKNRHNNDERAPKTFNVYGSINGTDFILLKTVINGVAIKRGEEFSSELISLKDFEQQTGQRPKIFRFAVEDTHNGDVYFCLAEFWLTAHETTIFNPETAPLD
jgi:hypothetical protein